MYHLAIYGGLVNHGAFPNTDHCEFSYYQPCISAATTTFTISQPVPALSKTKSDFTHSVPKTTTTARGVVAAAAKMTF